MSTSKTIENKLARIIQMIASNETDLENDRIALTKNPSFDPFQIFRDIDKQSKGYLNETDLALFLTNQKVFLQGKELQGVFSMKKDGTLKLTFQDFLHHVTPRSDSTLKNNVVNKIGKSETRSAYHTKGTVEDVERLIARIYKKESENIQQIENERYILASLGRAGLEESLALLADRTTGYLTFKTVAVFLKEHHFDLSITDFESFVRRVDTSKKGRIDIDDFKYFLAPNDSQMTSNYSSIGRDNTRYDLGKSVVDSFSSPLRQLAAGGPGPFNIHIHETHHIPTNISAISPHHSQHQVIHSSPPKLLSPGNKNFMSKIDLIQAQEDRLNRQFDNRGTYQLEERRLSRHATGASPTRLPTRTSAYSPTKQIITRTTTYSPGRNERETATFFSGRVGSIRDNYQSRPQTYNTSSNLDSIRRIYGLPENSARSRGLQDQAPLAYSTFLQKDLPPFSQAVQAVSNIPSSRLGYNEYRSSSIPPRQHTAGDYQDLPGQRLSHQRLSHDRRQTTEGRETLSRSPLRNSRPSAKLYEMKTPAYLQANLPPKYDIYAQDRGESLSRPSYIRPEIPLSYKSGAASRYLSNQNYASGGQIRSSSPGLAAGAGGYASRHSGGYDSKQYSTAYGGSIRTNTAFANATEGMRREEPIVSHIKTEPTRFSNVESQIESRRKARDNVANGGSGIKATRDNITSSVSGIGGIRDNYTSSIGGIGSVSSNIIGTSGALTREHLVSSGSGVKRETLTSSVGGGVAGRISPNGHLAGSANKKDYTSSTNPQVQEFSAGGASSSIQEQIEKRQKVRDGFPAGRSPSSLPSYTGTSPIRDPYRVSSHLETINETREGGLRYSSPRLEAFNTDVEKKSSLGGGYATSYQINETAAYPYPKSATSHVTIQETTQVTKTEGDQPAYSGSSYRFSNPKYEQLWSQ